MNLCAICRTDFASVAAFDRHRIGRHGYLFREGLAMVPPREDGRRCMDPDEMAAAGMAVDDRGRWAILADPGRFDALPKAA